MGLYSNAMSRIQRMAIASASGAATSLLNSGLGSIQTSLSQAAGNNVLANAAIGLGIGAVQKTIDGKINNFVRKLTPKSHLNGSLAKSRGVQEQTDYWNNPVPLLAGLTPREWSALMRKSLSISWAKSNFFLLEMSSPLYSKEDSDVFNMFATSASYSPITISGSQVKIGGTNIETPTSSEPVTLTLTTRDNEDGFFKQWFLEHAAATVNGDGTVGLPITYAIRIRIVHDFLTEETNQNGFEDIGLFRVANEEISLSRDEDGLELITATFQQLDPFMPT